MPPAQGLRALVEPKTALSGGCASAKGDSEAMERFGEFTVQEDLGRSLVCDRYKAMHDTLGGPFFVKRYTRCPPDLLHALHTRCERLMGINVPHLVPHLGHGETDEVPFVVSPFVDGVDLASLILSWREQRTTLPSETLVYFIQAIARAVEALRAVDERDEGPRFTHGDVCTRHVRLDVQGKIWLTGLATPRILVPDVEPAPIWDVAGAAAAAYELWPLTRKGQAGVAPSPALEAILREFLGIDPDKHDRSANELCEQLATMVEASRLRALSDADFAEWAKRAVRAYEKQQTERTRAGSGAAADALPNLEPLAPETGLLPPLPKARDVANAMSPPANVPREISLVTKMPTDASASEAPAHHRAGETGGASPEALELEPDRALVPLVEAGLIDAEALEPARIQAKRRDESTLAYLLHSERIDSLRVAQVLAAVSGRQLLARDALFEQLPRAELCRRVPRTYLKKRKILPLKIHDGTLRLAVVDPFQEELVREIQQHLRAATVQIVVVEYRNFADALSASYTPERLQGEAFRSLTTVLLCTPDEDWADAFGEELAAEGFRLEHAKALQQAYALCASVATSAMIIADAEIHTGIEDLVSTLQQNEKTRALPVYVITSHGDGTKAARLLELGVEDCLRKPVNVGLLAAKLRRTLASAKASSQREAVQSGATSASVSTSLAEGAEAAHALATAVLPTGVLGTLQQMPLPEVIQNLENGKKNALVELQCPDVPPGTLGFEAGQILYAACGDELGEAAFFRMVGFETGVFRIRFGKALPAHNVQMPTMYLLLEAMRRLDEKLPVLADSDVEDFEERTEPTPVDLE